MIDYERWAGAWMMLIVSLVLLIGYVLWHIYNALATRKARASFQHVIHVNGIRGKTTTCRLIDAHLRQAGYKVFTKTTGSTPCYIDVKGEEHVIRRWGQPNIMEQAAMLRKASKEGAQIVVMECMAVAPDLQRIAQERIVQGDWNVITNVRYDHVLEMGSTLEEIAESLSNTLPKEGMMFTSDEAFFPFFAEKCRALNTEPVLCLTDEATEDENAAIAIAIGKRLGIPAENMAEAMQGYKADFGAQKSYQWQNGVFLNLFSVNDPQSTLLLFNKKVPSGEKVTLLYNHRLDRPDRLKLFMDHFFSKIEYDNIIFIGEGRTIAKFKLAQAGLKKAVTAPGWRKAFDMAKTNYVVGIGNIKGQAYHMITFFENGEYK